MIGRGGRQFCRRSHADHTLPTPRGPDPLSLGQGLVTCLYPVATHPKSTPTPLPESALAEAWRKIAPFFAPIAGHQVCGVLSHMVTVQLSVKLSLTSPVTQLSFDSTHLGLAYGVRPNPALSSSTWTLNLRHPSEQKQGVSRGPRPLARPWCAALGAGASSSNAGICCRAEVKIWTEGQEGRNLTQA